MSKRANAAKRVFRPAKRTSAKNNGEDGRKQKGHIRLTDEQATSMLAESAIIGVPAAARRYEVDERTVFAWRKRLEASPDAQAKIAAKREKLEREWSDVAIRFLRKAVAKLEALVEQATPENIREVAGAIKVVGELGIARDVFPPANGQQPRTNPTRQTPASPKAANAARGVDEPRTGVH